MQDRPQKLHKRTHRPRDQQREAVGCIEGRGLRQHFAEHDDQHGHDDSRIDNTDVPEPREEKARRQRRTGDVSGIVADQQRAHQLLTPRQQPIHDARLFVAVLIEPHHRSSRGGRQGGSLPENRNDTNRQIATAKTISRSRALMGPERLFLS